jgi:hypothetical protein
MVLKKIAFIGVAIALVNLPLYANAASLTTINNTDEFSSVRVTSGFIHPCSGDDGHYTKPRDTLETSWDVVKFLCMSSGSVCTADIYMTPNCTGEIVANASLDLNNPNVVVTSLNPKKYFIIAAGTTVTMNYAS